MRAALLVAIVLSSVLGGCPQDTVTCTKEIRWAVKVTVVSPAGLEVDSVDADLRVSRPCMEFRFEIDAGDDALTFACAEQGVGTYAVRVTSGSLTWTQHVRVDGDGVGCHVESDTPELLFVLDPDTAD